MADAVDILEMLTALDIDEAAGSAIDENKHTIADLMASQLSLGIRADASKILPEYSPLTVELKKQKTGLASVTDRVTLFDTGEHYEELYAQVQGDDVEYGSRNDKSAKLEKKYGTTKSPIYGLTEDSKEELVNGPLSQSWQRNIEQQTGLKFQ